MNPYLQKGLHFLFPSTCVRCWKDIQSKSDVVCGACYADVSWISEWRYNLNPLRSVFSAVDFEGSGRDLIHAFKYKGKDYLTKLLVDIWTRNWNFDPSGIDALVPIPTSFWREKRRGYNQTLLLSKELGHRWSKPVITGCLGRSFFSEPQTGLSRSERRKNAQKTIHLKQFSFEKRKIRHILLIDDVLTTGATLQVSASLLMKAGIETVRASTLAREKIKKTDNH
ncbi:hypothetical protein BVX98_04785 [bacterium F11]|nr:hypothetical protein BVX98_04785 [bacterium F11]